MPSRGATADLRGAPLAGHVLEHPVGRGAAGEVWAARRVADGALAAIKLVAGGGDVLREVRFAAGLRHPGIVRVLDHGRTSAPLGSFPAGCPWIATELAEGTLAPRCGRVDSGELRAIADAILEALAHAHARGVLHRDVKPANVLLLRGRPALADFGIARALGAPSPGEGRVGTPRFMAPEQRGDRDDEQGPWTDLYAVGQTVLALAGGAERLAALGPPGVLAWVARLVASAPADRFRRAADARHVLLALADRGATGTLAPSVSPEVAPTWTHSAPLSLPLDPGEPAPDEVDALPCAGVEVPLDRTREIPADWRSPAELAAGNRLAPTGAALLAFAAAAYVGRDAERDHLWAALRRVAAERVAHLVWIEGAPGSGRTALARWFATRAAETGAADVTFADGRRGVGAVDLAVPSDADRPRLTVVDDVPPTAAAPLAEAIRAIEAGPGVLVVAVGRAPDASDGVHLGPLDDVSHQRMLREILALDVDLTAAIHLRTRGDPGLAVRWLRDLARDGHLVLGPTGHHLADGVVLVPPHADVDHWTTRWHEAPEGVRGWLAATAVLDPSDESELAAVGTALGYRDPEAFAQWLVDEQLSGTRLPAALRDVALAEIGARPDLHATCARVLAARGADPERVALHLADAGAWDEALPGLLDAARDHFRRRSTWAALALLDRYLAGLDALGATPDDRRRIVAEILRARTITRSDRRPEAVHALAAAEASADRAGHADLARLARTRRAEVLASLGRLAEAEQVVEIDRDAAHPWTDLPAERGPRALVWGPTLEPSALAFRFVRGVVRLQRGRLDEALADFVLAATHLPDSSRQPATRLAGVACLALGRFDEARAWIDLAWTLAPHGVARADVAIAQVDLALALGDIDGARTWCERALALARANPHGLGTVLCTSGWVALAAGDVPSARAAFAEALADDRDRRVCADALVGQLACALADRAASELPACVARIEALDPDRFVAEVVQRLHRTLDPPPTWVDAPTRRRLAALVRR